MRAGVLPHQGVAIEVVAAGAIPAHQVVGAVVGAALEERPDLFPAGQDTAALVHDPRDQRRLQDRIGGVQLQEGVAGGPSEGVCIHEPDRRSVTFRWQTKCVCLMMGR